MTKGLVSLNEAMSHVMEGHPRRMVIVKSSDNTWSTGGVNGKPLQYCCCENPMNSMRRQKDMTPENEPFRLEGVQYSYWGTAESNYQ